VSSNRGVLIVGGPTASGKTELALALAERFDAEIVGADSRQIYRGMPIGTAAPSAAQLARVPHHLVGVLDPYERYSAARFAHDALAAIREIQARGKRVVVAGGTGFYLRALCGDVALSDAYDAGLRARLAREFSVHPPEVMHAWLAARDPARAAAVVPGDRYRVARALEIALCDGTNGRSASAPQESLRAAGMPFVKLWLEVPGEVLEARIAARVERMLESGLLEEAERIGGAAVAADAVGYLQALAYLAGLSTFDELRRGLRRATRRYAKRQVTWSRSEPGVALVPFDDDEAVARRAEQGLGWRRAGCP
jgi:tRNA dimethylallyltransferase